MPYACLERRVAPRLWLLGKELAAVNPWFWAWVALTVVFALGETVTGGLLILPWAFGAGTAAVLEALGFPIGWQWISFLAVSSALTIVTQRFFKSRK